MLICLSLNEKGVNAHLGLLSGNALNPEAVISFIRPDKSGSRVIYLETVQKNLLPVKP